jgi:hypothetical protein
VRSGQSAKVELILWSVWNGELCDALAPENLPQETPKPRNLKTRETALVKPSRKTCHRKPPTRNLPPSKKRAGLIVAGGQF